MDPQNKTTDPGPNPPKGRRLISSLGALQRLFTSRETQVALANGTEKGGSICRGRMARIISGRIQEMAGRSLIWLSDGLEEDLLLVLRSELATVLELSLDAGEAFFKSLRYRGEYYRLTVRRWGSDLRVRLIDLDTAMRNPRQDQDLPSCERIRRETSGRGRIRRITVEVDRDIPLDALRAISDTAWDTIDVTYQLLEEHVLDQRRRVQGRLSSALYFEILRILDDPRVIEDLELALFVDGRAFYLPDFRNLEGWIFSADSLAEESDLSSLELQLEGLATTLRFTDSLSQVSLSMPISEGFGMPVAFKKAKYAPVLTRLEEKRFRGQAQRMLALPVNGKHDGGSNGMHFSLFSEGGLLLTGGCSTDISARRLSPLMSADSRAAIGSILRRYQQEAREILTWLEGQLAPLSNGSDKKNLIVPPAYQSATLVESSEPRS